MRRITESLSLTANDTVIEIGPGLGFLTRFLCETGASIVAVELDREAVADLGGFSLPGLNIVHADFLSYDLAEIKGPFKVVGNVPYQITTPIVCRLFGEIGSPQLWFSNIEKVVLTVQFEVAERFVAQPNTREYSQITLLTNYFCDAKILFQLAPEEFFPRPQVQSAVVEFTPRKNPPIDCANIKLLRQLIKAGFSQRRKMLRNNLSFLKLSDQELSQVFKQIDLDPQTRAERLSLNTFAELTNRLDEIMKVRSPGEL